MNTQKTLIGYLLIGLGIFGADSAFGANPTDTQAPALKQRFRPHAIKIPPARPAGPGMPCREVRRWSRMSTFTGCDSTAENQVNKVGQSTGNTKTFLKAHRQALGLRPDLSDLKVTKVKGGLSRTVTRFQQTFDNLPVLNAFVSVHQRPSGQVTTVHNSYISEPMIEGAATPVITGEEAKAIALEGIRQLSGISSLNLMTKASAELSWHPIDDRSVTLVWVVKARTHKPQGDYYTLVDASTGNRLLQEDRTVYADGTGMAYVPNPIQTSGILDLKDNNNATSLVLDGQRIPVDLLGLDEGTDSLVGEFVDVASYYPPSCTPPSARCPDAKSASRAYDYTRNKPEFEQVQVYYTIDSVQRYLRDTLGFKDDASGKALIRNFPTKVSVHWSADDNSFYSPSVDPDPITREYRGALHYGDGGVDDAEDADIVVHEFGHAIQHDQNPGCFPGGTYTPQVNEARAIGEGFSDYLAASFYAENEYGAPSHQALHAACVGEWDSTSYVPPSSCLRRVDGSKHYPEDLIGGKKPHPDGEIWSAALWDIRDKLGGRITDQLVLEHHFNLDCSNGVTMPQAALEMIDTDKLLFAGAHENVLRLKFCDRGILEGSACVPSGKLPTVVKVQKDSILVLGAPNRNEGASPQLHLRPVNGNGSTIMRVVLGFNLSNINRNSIESARLVMTVQNNPGGWGQRGRNVVVRPLKMTNFAEGSGRSLGVPAARKSAGNGAGITWNCYIDSNISNNVENCNTVWDGGTPKRRTAAPFVHTNDLQAGDKVSWDITDDIKNGASTWLVMKGNEANGGRVAYFAKEGNDSASAPRLEIMFK